MINGFTGLGSNELVGALSRSKYGQQSPPRNIQPMPKMDTVQVSVRGRELAASSESAGQRQPMIAERPVGTEKPASPASEMSLMDRMKAAFFSRQGDTGFDASVDLNKDGRVNYADLAVLREQDAPGDELNMLDRMRAAFFTRQGDTGFDASVDLNKDGRVNHADLAVLREQDAPGDELSMLDRMKAAFFTREGDERFDASVDLNADGRINNADLAVLREQGAPGNPDNPEEMLQHMRSSFMTRSGDERFDARVDMNSDGIINFADLAMLRAKLESGVTRPPAEPLAPAAPTAPEPVVAQDTAAASPRIDDQGATLESIRSAFFTSAGDASYTAAADINGDGRINFADLAELNAE